jgi:hypothetical protein
VRPAALLLAALGAAAVAGCDHRYEALTAPPPGMVASLDDENKSIRLTEGVSLAFECFEGSSKDACGRDVAIDDSTRALIFPADLDSLADLYREGPQPRSAFVVVGVAPGHTTVSAGGGSLKLEVLATEPK